MTGRVRLLSIKPPAAGWRAAASAAARRALALGREMAAGGASYAVFLRERRYWEQRRGGLRYDELFALLALLNLCLTPATLIIFPPLLLAQALLDEALSLAVAVPAASLVAGEREQGTWPVLRTTPLSSAQLLIGKLAGLLNLPWQGAAYVVSARLLGTLLALPLLGLMLLQSNPSPFVPGQPALVLGLGLALLYALFVYRPLLNLAFGGCLGLLASALAGSRAKASALAAGAHAVATLAGAGLAGWIASTGLLEGIFSGSGLGLRLEAAFAWLAPLGVMVLARLLVTPALFGLALYRVNRSRA
jgi:hypothetical protein